jgi:hypothetical protein
MKKEDSLKTLKFMTTPLTPICLKFHLLFKSRVRNLTEECVLSLPLLVSSFAKNIGHLFIYLVSVFNRY